MNRKSVSLPVIKKEFIEVQNTTNKCHCKECVAGRFNELKNNNRPSVKVTDSLLDRTSNSMWEQFKKYIF